MNHYSSHESELAVLASVLKNPSLFDKCDLEPIDFTDPAHSAIYDVGRELYYAKQPIDPVDVAVETSKRRIEVSAKTIVEIQTSYAIDAAFHRYVHQLKDLSKHRQLLQIGNQAFETVNSTDSSEVKSDKLTQLLSTCEPNQSELPPQCNDALREFIDDLERRSESEGVTGLSTGIKCIDEHTSGLQNSDLILLGARPAMGKTALAMNIVTNLSLKRREPVLFFSLEMSKAQLIERAASDLGDIDYSGIRTGKLQNDDWSKLNDTVRAMKDAPLYIDDTAGLKLAQIRARSRAIHRKYGVKLIVIDYIQLIRQTGRSKNEEVGEISRSLKELSKELNIPILCLSQLSRDVESRSDKRPRNSDLRDSGSLEQDADQIFFLYRDEIYDENTDYKDIAELICTKFRGGQTGTITLKCKLNLQRFETMEKMDLKPKEKTNFDW